MRNKTIFIVNNCKTIYEPVRIDRSSDRMHKPFKIISSQNLTNVQQGENSSTRSVMLMERLKI